jgi:MoxR-like ATPase
MLRIPLVVRDQYTKDGFHIIANDKPFLSMIEKIKDVPPGSEMEELQPVYIDKASGPVSTMPKSVRLDSSEPDAYKESIYKDKIYKILQTTITPDSIVESLKKHIDHINSYIIGREDIILQAIFALLTGEHMLILSRTGMAKSYLANAIFSIFDSARVFSSQASKDQTPDNYFGPYNMDEFRKGRIKHNIKGSVIEANFIFLDEFFDASDVVLRSLLSVLNERKFINGSEQIDTSVHTAIATANYMRANEVTEAILDRFTYKSIIPEMNNTYSQLKIDKSYEGLKGKISEPEKKIPFDRLVDIYNIITNRNNSVKIEIPDFIYFMKNVIVNKYTSDMRLSDSKFFVSPRKQAKLSDFLRASALFNGRREVNMDDVKDLYLALCTLNSHVIIKTVDKSEKDIYIDVYQKTMTHFISTGAIDQIRFLIDVKKILEDLKRNPDKKDSILSDTGPLASLINLLLKFFPGRHNHESGKFSIQGIKQSISELNPAVEEVHELKIGILIEFHDLV